MLPDPLFQIKSEKESANFGVFTLEPLQQGYGHTLGSAMRRVLLTSLPGAAVTQVKIDGVQHKFTTLKGLREDIVELILNIKGLRINYSGDKPVKISLEEHGPRAVTAKDIETPASVEIVNKDHVLANLADKARLKVDMIVESGKGYSPAEERETVAIGAIAIDAIFSPVLKVNYRVEAARVGRRTDLDRLIVEVETGGTISPSEAIKKAGEILVGYFKQVVNPQKGHDEKQVDGEKVGENFHLTIEEIGLPTRVVNALRQAGYGTVGDLVSGGSEQMAKVKNLGEKSIALIREALKSKGADLPEKK